MSGILGALRAVRAGVQGLCDAAPDAAHATAIAVAAGLGIKEKPVHTKEPFAGKALGNGVVRLAVKVPGKKGARVYYQWRMSTDEWKKDGTLPGARLPLSGATFCLPGSP